MEPLTKYTEAGRGKFGHTSLELAAALWWVAVQAAGPTNPMWGK